MNVQDTAIRAQQPATDAALQARVGELRAGLEHGLIGAGVLIERLLIGLLTGGHVLVEGAPGLAKTRAVKRLSAGLDATFARIQCTPDLMPADLTGTTVWRPDEGKFEFLAGPLFHSLVLVDEINRAPPKVQSALLEAMAERQVTAGANTHALPDPFMVVATQNPIEHEGTFPLPEAQLDRFLLHVVVGLPDAASERRILDLVEREQVSGEDAMPLRLSADEVRRARRDVANVHLAPALKDYIVRIVTATRDADAAPDVRRAIEYPVSPRGTLSLAAAAKARAYLHGRDYATPDDVAELAADTLAHRLVLTWRAAADGRTARDLVAPLLDAVRPL
ncbi:AAA family ATPase [Methylopila sp. Yamaguchi]|uniref:AAA family ATPase n=1 Tax=Methylopila sp. Yamaguchi TaxID=1437817 RepID=UPI000CAE91E6|nr:AAA family ATPase [Methylopila sp. Yamaguchi]GBD49445.1 ATPase AAA [Methylopila sp. Yamaguchi]